MRSGRVPAALGRRDLLLLRPTPRDRVFELPCQRLYMQFVDARRIRPSESPPDEIGLGEPEAVHDTRGVCELLDALARELREAEVLCLLEPEWLVDPELRREVDRLVAAFTARGGRVEADGERD